MKKTGTKKGIFMRDLISQVKPEPQELVKVEPQEPAKPNSFNLSEQEREKLYRLTLDLKDAVKTQFFWGKENPVFQLVIQGGNALNGKPGYIHLKPDISLIAKHYGLGQSLVERYLNLIGYKRGDIYNITEWFLEVEGLI